MTPNVHSPTTPKQYDLLTMADGSPLNDPKCTWPYYTTTVLSIDKCRHTQGRWTPPSLTPSVHSPTTPKQYDLLTRADGPPEMIPSVHKPTTPKQYYLLRNADIPRMHKPIDKCRGTQCGHNLSQVRNGKG